MASVRKWLGLDDPFREARLREVQAEREALGAELAHLNEELRAKAFRQRMNGAVPRVAPKGDE